MAVHRIGVALSRPSLRGGWINFGPQTTRRGRQSLSKFSGRPCPTPEGYPQPIADVRVNYWEGKSQSLGYFGLAGRRTNYFPKHRPASDGRCYWYCGGVVYWTDDGSSSTDVKNALDARAIREQRKRQKDAELGAAKSIDETPVMQRKMRRPEQPSSTNSPRVDG